jgi:hypothetical protein
VETRSEVVEEERAVLSGNIRPEIARRDTFEVEIQAAFDGRAGEHGGKTPVLV